MTPQIILFNGPPRSGKDTGTQFAKEILGLKAITYRFAAPLKGAIHELFGFGNVATEYFSNVKNTPRSDFYGMTPREAYIWLSEEVAKPKFGRDFFAKVAVTNIKRSLAHYGAVAYVVISDCGFQEEFDVLAKEFGKENVHLIRLKRAGCDFKGDSRGYIESHNSRGLVNDASLGEFRQQIQRILKEIINA